MTKSFLAWENVEIFWFEKNVENIWFVKNVENFGLEKILKSFLFEKNIEKFLVWEKSRANPGRPDSHQELSATQAHYS